ncbi:MAG: thioredoxin domain-containing protein [Acidobacteriota bacterium]
MHSISSRSLVFVALASFGLGMAAVAAEAPKSAAPPAPAASSVLATVDGSPVTRQEIDAAIVEQVVTRQPNVLDTVLAQVIDNRVLDLEAAKQKITRDQLLDREVKAKITPVTDAEIDAFYEEKKAQINAPKEQIAAQIKSYLENQRQQEAYGKYVQQLRASHAVKDMLADQRIADEAVKAVERRGLIENTDAPSFGAKNASVVLVEFSDFQCPFCARATPAIQEVKKNYADRVRVVFHQLPLNSIHPFAQKAAEAALCADEQGKFWEMHDLLFKEQDKLAVGDLKDKATRVGVNADQFNGCLDGGKMAAKVAAEVDLGTKLGVGRTPTLYLNGREVGYDGLTKEVDAELAKTKK